MFIGGCVIGQVLVVYWCGTSLILPIYTYKLVYALFLSEQLWVVNSETQSDEWVVNSETQSDEWVVNSETQSDEWVVNSETQSDEWVVNPETQSDEWVVNSETQSDEWVVNVKSWLNYTWNNIQTDIILQISNLEMQVMCHFQLTLKCPEN